MALLASGLGVGSGSAGRQVEIDELQGRVAAGQDRVTELQAAANAEADQDEATDVAADDDVEPVADEAGAEEPDAVMLPDVAGMSFGDACRAIRDAGSHGILERETRETADVPDGQVIETPPAAGSEVGARDAIPLYMAEEPASASSPRARRGRSRTGTTGSRRCRRPRLPATSPDP